MYKICNKIFEHWSPPLLNNIKETALLARDGFTNLTIESDTGQHSQFLQCFMFRFCPSLVLYPSSKEQLRKILILWISVESRSFEVFVPVIQWVHQLCSATMHWCALLFFTVSEDLLWNIVLFNQSLWNTAMLWDVQCRFLKVHQRCSRVKNIHHRHH